MNTIIRTLKGSLLALALSSTALANEIYVEQVDDGSTITITQSGNSNMVGDSVTPVFIGGGQNTVTIDQIGAGNQLAMVVNGAGTDVIVSAIGDLNNQTINCGSTISASCSGSIIRSEITGDNNTTTQNLGSGGAHESKILITGNSNNVTHTSTATGTVNTQITVVGDTNTIGVTQSGALPKVVNVSHTGNNNTVSITQTD
jgi:hypothetical protein